MATKISPPELISFESLFKNRLLIIPHYQRDYIWKKDNWKQWLEDVEKLINCEDVEEIHFVGCIIYKEISGTNLSFPEYLIIDGQQRITTFFVFSLVILKLLEEDSSKSVSSQIKTIKQLLFSDKQKSRLKVGGEKENSVQAFIRHKNPENNEEGVSRAYQWFKKELGRKKVKKHLEDYFNNLKDRVKFVSIKLGEKEDALEIFKSINTSGVVLTSNDLIKAEFFIIYEERNLEIDKLAEEWEDMKKRVGKENANHFFYTFLCTKFKKTNEYSEKNFYTFFKDKLLKSLKSKEEKEKIEELWSEIVKKSEIYGQILNPKLDYWGELFYSTILEMKLLGGIRQLIPLIIVLKSRGLQNEKSLNVLQKLIIFSFRKKIKGQQFQKSDVLKWTWLVQNEKIEQVENILDDKKIVEEIEKSDIFWDELEEKKLEEKQIKWLLKKFYVICSTFGNFISPSLQLEHMFPKNPNEEWWTISEWKKIKGDEAQINEKLYSLGNATLLTPKKNISVNNKVWKEKRKDFKEKTFLQYEKNELNLLEKEKLLPEDIYNRKKWLVQKFKQSGILFIDERKEKSQIEAELKD